MSASTCPKCKLHRTLPHSMQYCACFSCISSINVCNKAIVWQWVCLYFRGLQRRYVPLWSLWQTCRMSIWNDPTANCPLNFSNALALAGKPIPFLNRLPFVLWPGDITVFSIMVLGTHHRLFSQASYDNNLIMFIRPGTKPCTPGLKESFSNICFLNWIYVVLLWRLSNVISHSRTPTKSPMNLRTQLKRVQINR